MGERHEIEEARVGRDGLFVIEFRNVTSLSAKAATAGSRDAKLSELRESKAHITMAVETHTNGEGEQAVARYMGRAWHIASGAAETSESNEKFSRGGVMLQSRKFLSTCPPRGSSKVGVCWRASHMPSPWWTATFVKLRKVWVLVAAG
jgi:hypothetical protein